MADQPLTPVSEALRRILAAAAGRGSQERVPVADAHGRVLAEDLAALRDSPPFDVSSMDGYALQAADTASNAGPIRVVGESAAGRPFNRSIGPGEAVRIFTGARIPDGADAVLLQERAAQDGETLKPQIEVAPGTSIRRAGIDFAHGDVLLSAGARLSPGHVALAAAMNHAEIPVGSRPVIAILATGDELISPGQDGIDGAIVASNDVGVAAIIREAGGMPVDLGIARDTPESLEAGFRAAITLGADCLVTLGGASVGRHDLVRPVAAGLGARLDFYRIAMRPGKPLNFGTLGDMLLLGLPGNPVSAMVCAELFLRPLVAALQGNREAGADRSEPAILGAALPANDEREDFLRATLTRNDAGQLVATPFNRQDSSLLARYARAQALVIRAPFAPLAATGEACRILRL
jgi:molybdopterin molybdotransferase